ncbi:hypothetical protein [Bhargavaea beijingensis]|uniref:hypothetical protein n=1 Tax=Bhargavaea beijingensis TaxID=426756 RepID=UPI002224D509|nr:hypothetical protein [Bhargavaea beijingensis]MCW1927405.1 hypothetical protein [Bhargavaea beijingensis]
MRQLGLKHYTSNLESAKSIIHSRQLWLRNTGMTKDSEEIFHYFNIFNDLHVIEDINSLISKNFNPNSKASLYEFYITSLLFEHYYKEHSLQIGQVLADVIRNESYLICFTEESGSMYHEDSYGPIAFLFTDNPLIKNDISYQFIKNKITYISKEKYEVINKTANDIFKVSDLPRYYNSHKLLNEVIKYAQDELSGYSKSEHKRKRKDLLKLLTPLIQSIQLATKDFSAEISPLFILSEQINPDINDYLNNRVNEIRKERILDRFSPEYRAISGDMFHAEKAFEHGKNLISCFIKDSQFEKDNETRIIALPLSKQTNEGNNLKVNINMNKLEKISVSQSVENRKFLISELKDFVQSRGLNPELVE